MAFCCGVVGAGGLKGSVTEERSLGSGAGVSPCLPNLKISCPRHSEHLPVGQPWWLGQSSGPEHTWCRKPGKCDSGLSQQDLEVGWAGTRLFKAHVLCRMDSVRPWPSSSPGWVCSSVPRGLSSADSRTPSDFTVCSGATFLANASGCVRKGQPCPCLENFGAQGSNSLQLRMFSGPPWNWVGAHTVRAPVVPGTVQWAPPRDTCLRVCIPARPPTYPSPHLPRWHLCPVDHVPSALCTPHLPQAHPGC